MRYTDDTMTNELIKTDNGERELVTYDELMVFVGDDEALTVELLLDILNKQLPVDDAIRMILS